VIFADVKKYARQVTALFSRTRNLGAEKRTDIIDGLARQTAPYHYDFRGRENEEPLER
jgi:hypothetical protein